MDFRFRRFRHRPDHGHPDGVGNKSAAGRSGTVVFRASDKQECAVTVTQAGADLAGYDKWVQDSFPPDATADRTAADAAPAGDGVTNLMKYATGLDPLKPCGSVTKVSVEEGVEGSRHLVLRWPVNPQAAEVKHEVEVSPDLVNWTSLGEVETAGKTSAEFRDAEPVQDSAMKRRFLRLKVTRENFSSPPCGGAFPPLLTPWKAKSVPARHGRNRERHIPMRAARTATHGRMHEP